MCTNFINSYRGEIRTLERIFVHVLSQRVTQRVHQLRGLEGWSNLKRFDVRADFCVDMALILVEQVRVVGDNPLVRQNAPCGINDDVQSAPPVFREAVTDK